MPRAGPGRETDRGPRTAVVVRVCPGRCDVRNRYVRAWSWMLNTEDRSVDVFGVGMVDMDR